ncbi:MAG: hypothetical protein ACYDDA_06810 [Acidiferrobacteraceae bacterium]
MCPGDDSGAYALDVPPAGGQGHGKPAVLNLKRLQPLFPPRNLPHDRRRGLAGGNDRNQPVQLAVQARRFPLYLRTAIGRGLFGRQDVIEGEIDDVLNGGWRQYLRLNRRQ